MEEDRISRDFTWREMVYSETAVKHGIPNSPGKKETQAIRELVKRLLQPLRIAYGKPVRISSGYRSPELNRLVGGVPSSQHVKGEAADCVVDDPEELLTVLLANNFPFDQAILYRKKGFLHLSLRATYPNRKRVIVR
ncbi:MAG: D-Ala-D-Ala carboxypeptidase family metallohydrolase [Tannerellaceae bacterium]|nr:D-Ala-D-Ala carboxypeptidase family metallohydrolase [Tannerellaceae bacterium]